MKNLVCFLEEESAVNMLRGILSRIFPDLIPRLLKPQYIKFQGKQDFKKKLYSRLRGYRLPDACFLVILDQDFEDCLKLKNELREKVASAGKSDMTLIRIACRELESFFFGDLAAVETALNVSGLSDQQNNSKYRNPDMIDYDGGELKRITSNKYRKGSGSREISRYLKLDGSNRSKSFNSLISGLRMLLGS